MHDVMAGYAERGEVPGIVTAVSRRGDAHVDAIGTKAVGGGAPVARDTIVRIAAMTKPIIAVATLILGEERVLRVDAPVERRLPEAPGGRRGRGCGAARGATVPRLGR